MPSHCLTTPNHSGTKATSAFSSFIQVESATRLPAIWNYLISIEILHTKHSRTAGVLLQIWHQSVLTENIWWLERTSGGH
jgi:hypothetical protein